MSTEAVLITSAIDGLEEREVAVAGILGASLSADMDNEVYVRFQGTLTEIMVAEEPSLYRPFVSYKGSKAALYVQLQKALYGCLKRILLFYKYLAGDLEVYGFLINPHNP